MQISGEEMPSPQLFLSTFRRNAVFRRHTPAAQRPKFRRNLDKFPQNSLLLEKMKRGRVKKKSFEEKAGSGEVNRSSEPIVAVAQAVVSLVSLKKLAN